MKYRPHRGSLADAMAEMAEIEPTREALIRHVRSELQEFPTIRNFHEQHLRIKPYGCDDDRIGWKDVHVVTLDGYGVMGFCEGNVVA
jgi:phosphoribosyl 1,2-cyclic phosphodiesterase